MKKSIFIIFIILLIDQWSKIYVKTHFSYGESLKVFDWFYIHFIENNGMAWGVEFGGKTGKFLLTLFRIIAISGIGYWLFSSIKKGTSTIFIIATSLIFAGAVGNILDSVFYGTLFNNPEFGTATLFTDKPYEKLFFGKVVDMFYFPMWSGNLPEWLPFWGGKHFTFFNAVFNVADTSISTGVGILIVFYRRIFPKKVKNTKS